MSFLAGGAGAAAGAGAAEAGAAAGAGAAGASAAAGAGAAGTGAVGAGAAGTGAVGAGTGAAGSALSTTGLAGATGIEGRTLAIPTSASEAAATPGAGAAVSDAAGAAPATAAGSAGPSASAMQAAITGGSGFNNPQGFIGGFIQNLLGTGFKQSAAATPPDVAPSQVGSTGSTGSVTAGLPQSTKPKGFLGLTDEERGQFLRASLQDFIQSSLSEQFNMSRAQALYGEGRNPGATPAPIGAPTSFDPATGLPMMQAGGTLAPGEQAIVGEAGPEVVQAHPQGGATVVPAPQTQTPQAPTPGQPTETAPPLSAGIQAAESGAGVWPHVKAFLEDSLITIGGLRNPSLFLSMQQMQQARMAALVQTAAQNPQLLETNPAVADAVDRFLGPGTSAALSPTGHNALLAQQLGVSIVPPGTKLPDGSVAPAVAAQLIRARPDLGLQVDAKGYVTARTVPPTFKDRAALGAWSLWQDTVSRLTQSGMPFDQAAKQAAVLAIRQSPLPPSELYNLAMGDIAAEEIADARNRSTLRFARAIAQERAVGEATGRLPFEAQLAEQRRAGTEVGKSKGAAAIAAAAGGPGAVNLGVNPSKEVLKSFAARPGWTQTTGPGGEVIMIPPPPTPEQVEKAPAGVDQNVWNAMTPQDRANFVQLTERPAGVPATVSLVEPRAIGAFNVAMENLKELTSPDVVNAFPDEGQVRELARVKAQTWDRVTSNLTDPASVETARQLAQNLKVQLAMLESFGSVRGGVIAMTKTLEGLLDGIQQRSLTRQQFVERILQMARIIKAYDPTRPLVTEPGLTPETESRLRAAEAQVPVSPAGQQLLDRARRGEFSSAPQAAAPQAAAPPVSPALRRLAEQLDRMVTAGQISRDAAVQRLRAARQAGL